MKAIIQCYTPQECERIANGEQTVKVCKTAPKEVPFKVYIYQTKESKRRFLDHRFNSFFAGKSHYKDMGKVIGEFICDRVFEFKINGDDYGNYWHEWDDEGDIQDMCLSYEELETYLGKSVGYGWHISELKIYDNLKKLSEFKKYNRTCKFSDLGYAIPNCKSCRDCNLNCPPRSWCYVEEN